jgi:hypothetical protein
MAGHHARPERPQAHQDRPLKKVVQGLGYRAGGPVQTRRDPRPAGGAIHVSDWYARFAAASGGEGITAVKNRSLWATHCEPKWSSWPMSAITRMEAQGWVGKLRETRLARWRGRVVQAGDEAPLLLAETVYATVHIMSSLYRAAMKEHPPIVLANPFAELALRTGVTASSCSTSSRTPNSVCSPAQRKRIWISGGPSLCSGRRDRAGTCCR